MERKIKEYLEQQEMHILDVNYRCKQGEIDLVAKDGRYYVFIEVKYRSSLRYGAPGEAVGSSKQHRICNAAKYYLYSHHLGDDTPVRFDVASVLGEEITYYKNAFFYCEE